ncbi:aminopeptidase N-like [Uranotaenia lowii]|uniref:aminopeptidase N-like n=1 Tax=Uranotaenia lowii TaxID=190385 RepID=UPI00247AA85F|nr:aminopeptidase N-like [Uranotaenia lowii]
MWTQPFWVWLLVLGTGALLVSAATEDYRLPLEVTPRHYDLEVHTHLGDDNEGFRFEGRVKILVTANSDTNVVTLHAKNLTLDEDGIRVELNGREVPVASLTIQDETDFIIIQTRRKLLTGKNYTISIPFEADFGTAPVGYYRSSYESSDSQEPVWLSITQFQAIYARRGFPCFDEPELKATFNVSLGHHKRYNALSNMPLLSREVSNVRPNWIIDTFEKSVLMSPYLVGYSINDYSSLEAEGGNSSVSIRSWTRREAVENLRYANELAVKLIPMYERNFELPFPLPKLDLITINNMLFAAMENWGLVTFTEGALEYSPASATLDEQHFVASVVSHEIAHMWFGNLVTMRWWTDLWLNEGFARYTEFLAIEELHPEWKSLQEIAIEDVMEIFKFDALNNSHRVSIEIGNPEEIPQLFDSISYKKGSALVRMMHLFLGDDAFFGGVARYLKKFQYSNAEQNDLWQSLTEEAKEFEVDLDVKAIMDTWTLQTGYPVVYVDRNYTDQTVTFQQMRFLYDETVIDPACWWIPLTLNFASNFNFDTTQPQMWLGCTKETTPKVTNVSSDDWILLNSKLAGLYKVQYDERNYKLLINHLNGPSYSTINTVNRGQLIDDSLDLAWAGLQDYGIAFSLLNYLSVEQEYIPWKAALSNMDQLDRVLARTDSYDMFEAYARKLLQPIYEKLDVFQSNLTMTSVGQIRLKKLVTEWACSKNITDCVSSSIDLFERWFTTGENTIPVEIRPTVYCFAIQEGSQQDWQFLWERYQDSNVYSFERFSIAQGLACTKNTTLMEQLLDWSIQLMSGLRLEHTTEIFNIIAAQPEGTPIAKRFLFENIDRMEDYVNPESFESRLASHVKVLAERIVTTQELEELQQFVEAKQTLLAGNSLAIAQALEQARINIQWMNRSYPGFATVLRQLADNDYDASKLS